MRGGSCSRVARAGGGGTGSTLHTRRRTRYPSDARAACSLLCPRLVAPPVKCEGVNCTTVLCFNQTVGFPLSAPVLSRLFHVLGKSRSSSLATPRQVRPLDRGPALSPAKLLPETPRPNPQSQSFSRSYGSILPTSLTYIVLSTRGCSPWRPDAVMSTTGVANKSLPRIFKGRREGIGHLKD